MTIAEYEEALRSGDIPNGVPAMMAASVLGDHALQVAAKLLREALPSAEAGLWCLHATSQFADTHPDVVGPVATSALADPSSAVRGLAIAIVSRIRFAPAAKALASLLADRAVDGGDWSGETTLGQSAAAALRSIGTSEALTLLRSQPSP
jgi:hypothetical protein